MDIYSYINSRDVAAYCCEINKVWTPFEMAVIIGRSQRTIAEKHSAWCELITDYPDMPTPENMHFESYASLHKRLTEVIDYENHAIALFKTPEMGAVYRYRVWWNNEYRHSDSVFNSFEIALNNARERWERSEVLYITIEKVYVDDKGSIVSDFDYDGNLYWLNVYGSCTERFPDIDFETSFGTHKMFDDMFYLDIPVPFKKGDIITGRTRSGDLAEYIFILDTITGDDPKMITRYQTGELLDGTDMLGWGLFVDDEGVLFGDHTIYYDCYEYYKGKLEGKYGLLLYVSLYLKNEISLSELLAMQCRLMLKHQLDNGLRVDIHGRTILERFIVEERLSNQDKKHINLRKKSVVRQVYLDYK